MDKQRRDFDTRFKSPYREPRAERPIALRLPVSLDQQLRELCGDDPKKIRAFVEQAIAEALEGHSNSEGL